MTVIIFIAVLAVLIFVHELGHFLAARMCGIRVDRFAIGFGPSIFSKKKGETTYSINIIPFGGYVKIFGEDPNSDSISGPDASRSFVNKNRWQQAFVLFAGVLFNALFAWILYAIVFSSGITVPSADFSKYSDRFTTDKVMITQVSADSPAYKAGLKQGDVVKSVTTTGIVPGKQLPEDGNAEEKISHIQETIASSVGAPVAVNYERRGEEHTAIINPQQGIIEDKYAIGIAMQNFADLKLPVIPAIYESARYTAVLTKETAIGLYFFVTDIFRGSADFSTVTGPVGIADIVGDAADLGWKYLLMITAIISINLAIINLIPFPALDGGRMLFVGIEGVIRRRIPVKFFNIMNTIGFALLMLLMIVVTWKDIVKLIK